MRTRQKTKRGPNADPDFEMLIPVASVHWQMAFCELPDTSQMTGVYLDPLPMWASSEAQEEVTSRMSIREICDQFIKLAKANGFSVRNILSELATR